MSGVGKSLVQHGPNTYCVLGTVEEEKVTGDLLPAFWKLRGRGADGMQTML